MFIAEVIVAFLMRLSTSQYFGEHYVKCGTLFRTVMILFESGVYPGSSSVITHSGRGEVGIVPDLNVKMYSNGRVWLKLYILCCIPAMSGSGERETAPFGGMALRLDLREICCSKSQSRWRPRPHPPFLPDNNESEFINVSLKTEPDDLPL